MNRLIIIGAGELGHRVGRLWVESGGPCLGVTATTARHAELRASGIEPSTSYPTTFETDDRLLICVPGTDKLQDAVTAFDGIVPPTRIVLTSSTGRYHGVEGTIDADTPPGQTQRAQSISQMEAAFSTWAGPSGVIMNLGGLYRAGRGPMNMLKKRGRPPAGSPEKTLALIHYDDAATATFEALRHPNPRPRYIGVSPPCPTRREFYLAASVILNLDLPSFGRISPTTRAEYVVAGLRTDVLSTPKYPKWQAALLP
ncbi:MAG: hypothetical protein VX589_12105 [Myxococcota bacterium]|nr:hypothetical protein [Myxococcota bacterium]